MTDATTETGTPNGERAAPAPGPGSMDVASDLPPVRLVIPASARYLRLARLTAAGLAGDLGYGVDAIEDLRIAVDELCATLIEDTEPTAELALTYRELDGGLLVEGLCDDGVASAPELHGVAKELLAMLADEYTLGVDDRGRSFRLVKHRPPRSAD